ncbi:MAG TPA: hypothetical protein VLA04_04535, partial [Verrucomicrobiae bacterium]|nr:hypothetical protein [Verrucomicrobiae bacterium]
MGTVVHSVDDIMSRRLPLGGPAPFFTAIAQLERGFSHLPQIRAALLYGSTAQLLATPEKLTLADDLQVILLYSADTPAEEIDLRCGLGELVGDLRGRPLGITCNVHLVN